MICVEIANRQRSLRIERKRFEAAVRQVLERAGCQDAEVSLAIVGDATMARLHGRYLDDPTPTDVLSFVLEAGSGALKGEVIVSAETAARRAARYGWTPADELLLYTVHGALHLAGYDDATPAQRRQMRRHERAVLASFGLRPSYRARAAAQQPRRRPTP